MPGGRFYGGNYYGPRFVDQGPRVDVGAEIAAAIEGYIGHRRQSERDRREQEEHEYQVERRKTLDPLEEALLLGQLHERGIVRSDRDGKSGAAPAASEPAGGSSIADVLEDQRGGDAIVRGQRMPQAARIAAGIAAPGSFNPVTGTFNPPTTTPRPQMDLRPEDRSGRVPLGGGFELDPALTTEGRRRGREDELIAALVRSGVPREEATVEVRSGLEGAVTEHFHPGPYHPRTRDEALGFLEGELQRREQSERRLIAARGGEERRTKATPEGTARQRDPRWEERRNSWIQELGRPTTQLQQDLLDALADGDEPDEILEVVPRTRRAEAERYLRRAVRARARQTGGQPPEPIYPR